MALLVVCTSRKCLQVEIAQALVPPDLQQRHPRPLALDPAGESIELQHPRQRRASADPAVELQSADLSNTQTAGIFTLERGMTRRSVNSTSV